jgi:hypothetical protein
MKVSDVVTVIICDDIRKEVTQKETLVGVFTGDIVLLSFPNWFAASIWIEMFPKEAGRHEIDFRISLRGKEPLVVKLVADVMEVGPMSAALPGLQIFAEEPGEFIVEMKEGDDWYLLKKKKVIQGEVSSPFPMLIGSAKPVGD